MDPTDARFDDLTKRLDRIERIVTFLAQRATRNVEGGAASPTARDPAMTVLPPELGYAMQAPKRGEPVYVRLAVSGLGEVVVGVDPDQGLDPRAVAHLVTQSLLQAKESAGEDRPPSHGAKNEATPGHQVDSPVE